MSNTGIANTPQIIGAALNAAAVVDLALLDVSGMTLGTKVYVPAVPGYYKLAVSSAAVDHDAAEAVAGYSTLRWLLEGAGTGTVTSVTGTAPIAVATGTSTPVVSIVAATASVPGSMSAADKAKLDLVPSPVGTRATAGSAVQDLTVSGLTGDTDGDYEIVGRILYLANGALVKYSLQPNAITTNQQGAPIYATGAATGSFAQLNATLGISQVQEAVAHALNTLDFRATLSSKTGSGGRLWNCNSILRQSSGAAVQMTLFTGVWEEAATAITSLVLHSDTAASILTGSYIRVRKLGFTA